MIIQIGLNNWIVSIVKYVAVEIVYNDDTNEPLMMTLWAVNELHYETLMMTLKSNNDDANSNILLPCSRCTEVQVTAPCEVSSKPYETYPKCCPVIKCTAPATSDTEASESGTNFQPYIWNFSGLGRK